MNPKPAKRGESHLLIEYRAAQAGSRITTVMSWGSRPRLYAMPASQARKRFGRQVAVFEGVKATPCVAEEIEL